jgi:uncharacterized protein (TIGR00369 family)
MERLYYCLYLRMPAYTPKDDNYIARVRNSFARQPFMQYLHAALTVVQPGYCEISIPFKNELTQQHGFFHAGVVGTLADNAGGYAAYSLMAATSSILTVEYKLNLLAPAKGDRLVGKSKVVKYGRTLTICQSEVYAVTNNTETLCAIAQMTLIELPDTEDKR